MRRVGYLAFYPALANANYLQLRPNEVGVLWFGIAVVDSWQSNFRFLGFRRLNCKLRIWTGCGISPLNKLKLFW